MFFHDIDSSQRKPLTANKQTKNDHPSSSLVTNKMEI